MDIHVPAVYQSHHMMAGHTCLHASPVLELPHGVPVSIPVLYQGCDVAVWVHLFTSQPRPGTHHVVVGHTFAMSQHCHVVSLTNLFTCLPGPVSSHGGRTHLFA